ncbi:hypothetical protein ACFPJ4_03510 [Lysinimonas soli]|uniref:DUF4175 domain-containing protein n=1 Tax=Lysinimonas soli TaxID=1074233 RepID=A0ABW0NL56_9MICO
MRTRRFNWIVLLVGGVLCVLVGLLDVLSGRAPATVTWFVFGAGLLVGSVILRRMRLP